jgi:hypothetical protein
MTPRSRIDVSMTTKLRILERPQNLSKLGHRSAVARCLRVSVRHLLDQVHGGFPCKGAGGVPGREHGD